MLDARPANAYEDPYNPWVRSLASVEQLRFVFLEDDEDVFVHSEDIRDFYHGFQVQGERSRRNTLRIRQRPKACRGLEAFRSELEHEEWLVPALKTVAMGNTAAVGLAQCAHLGVILSTGCIDLRSFVTLEGRPPRSGPICGLMIDDFVVLDRVRRRRPVPQGPRIIGAVRAAYSKVGLPRHEKKTVEGEPAAEFWGCELDGKSGKVRPNYKRAVPLGFLVLRLVGVGRATSELLDSLVGGLVSCFQYRRRCLSLLQRVYSDPRPRDRSASFVLSKGAIGELVAAVALLPQCDIDLRAKAVPFVLASDASNEAEAGAICPVPLEAAREMYRHTISKGLWNKLLSPVAAYCRGKGTGEPENELPGQGEFYSSHPLWEELATSQPFFDFGRIVYVRVPRHINIGEMRAALRTEERLARKHQDVRFVLLQDSQVSLAAMSKGRSSSSSLSRELRRSLGTYLGAGLRPGYAYLQSKLNPPDDRTRNTPLRSPSRDASPWFREFLGGSLDSLDRFLTSVQLDDRQVQGLPDPAEITLPPAAVGVAPTSTPVSSAEESGYGVWPPPKPEATPHESLRLRRERRARLRPFPPLSSSTARLLQDLDFGLFSFHPTCRELLASFRAGSGWLGIGSGASGLLGALRGSGLTPWTWCCDLVSELETTVNGAERRRVLNECIRAGCVQGMYLRPSAGTFSAAVRPPLRSKEFPSGIPSCSLQQWIRLERGNDELAWVQDLCRLANASGVAVVIDHPQNSLLWKQPGWEVCQEASGWADSSFDLCRFGAPFRKPTKLRVRGLFGSQQASLHVWKASSGPSRPGRRHWEQLESERAIGPNVSGSFWSEE